MDTRDIYAGRVCVPEKIRVVTSELLSVMALLQVALQDERIEFKSLIL